MTHSLQNKTALITGASRGIGRAVALRLASDGAHVFAHYGSSREQADSLVAEIERFGGRATAVQADLSDPQAVETLARETQGLLGGAKLDILVNNAGVAEFVPFADTDAATIDRQYAVNVRAPFLLTKALRPALASDASVVFLSSVVAKNYFPDIPAYSITKGAVDTLVQHLAAELGADGIRVNAVAPGVIETDMSDWVRSEDGARNAKSIQALQRIGQPEDIAGTVAFLAGPDSGWVTGQVIDTSGGTKL